MKEVTAYICINTLTRYEPLGQASAKEFDELDKLKYLSSQMT